MAGREREEEEEEEEEEEDEEEEEEEEAEEEESEEMSRGTARREVDAWVMGESAAAISDHRLVASRQVFTWSLVIMTFLGFSLSKLESIFSMRDKDILISVSCSGVEEARLGSPQSSGWIVLLCCSQAAEHDQKVRG